MITKGNIIEKYNELNGLAQKNGVVIFGGYEDKDIAMCELKQAFFPDTAFYNRSIDGISIENAKELYLLCIAPLVPDTMLLHIGIDDLGLCRENPARFEMKYRELISEIRKTNKKCDIAIIDFKNTDLSADIEYLNKKLKYIADSETCTFCDISNGYTRSSLQAKKEISFIYNLGFISTMQRRHPIYDMAEIMFSRK